MSDSADGKASANGPRAAAAVARPLSKPPPPPGAGVVAHRPTTRMTADEIAAAIADASKARGEGVDDENTPVLDPIDDAADESNDDAPTADYDPRSNVGRAVNAAAGNAAASASASADAGRPRRTSRRTVKIPDDQVNRPHPSPSPPVVSVVSPPPKPDEPPVDGSPPRSSSRASHPDAQTEPPPNEEVVVLKPMRIISIGSDPPPPITSAVAEWPARAREPDSKPPPSSAVETVRKPVDSITKTDLLPPAAIPEDGWTPAAPMVAPALPNISAARAEKTDEDHIDVEVETTDTAADDTDLLEEIEPDAAPLPAKKPPPPPARPKPAEAGTSPVPPVAAASSAGSSHELPEGKKPKPWYEDVFSEDYIKTIDILAPEHVKKEVDFIEESLGIERDGMILDLACGRGEHAIDLAQRGYNVVGLDLSPVALACAHDNLKKALSRRASRASSPKAEGAAEEKKPSFLRADMRSLDFEENFDGAYCWATSFGYFDDETNLLVLKRLHRALRSGGMLLIDVANRDYIAPRSPSLVWFEGEGCVCMDDMSVDFLTSRMRVKRTAMFEDGHSRELEYSIRLYSLDALGRLLQLAGFKVIQASGLIAHPGIFFGTESPRLIVLAERA